MADLETPPFDLSAPGSYLYDGWLAAAGMRLNRFGNGLKIAANRAAFRADPEGYLTRADLTHAEREAIRLRDWAWLVAHGGHVQAMQRIAGTDGQYLFHVAAGAIGVDPQVLIDACPRCVTGLGGIDG